MHLNYCSYSMSCMAIPVAMEMGKVRTYLGMNSRLGFRRQERVALNIPLIPPLLLTDEGSYIELPDDEQWKAIVASSNLPDEARYSIGWAILRYRAGDQARQRSGSAETRSSLQKSIQAISKLRRQSAELLDNARALTVLARSLRPSHGVADGTLARQTITKAILDLDEQSKWLSSAIPRVAKSGPGAREKSILLAFLVHDLDKVRQQYGQRPITRSTKRIDNSRDYITAVCRIADPTIGGASIDEAMKRVIKGRGGIRR
jgi:hypothetical protein